jgi:hypothetical protein
MRTSAPRPERTGNVTLTPERAGRHDRDLDVVELGVDRQLVRIEADGVGPVGLELGNERLAVRIGAAQHGALEADADVRIAGNLDQREAVLHFARREERTLANTRPPCAPRRTVDCVSEALASAVTSPLLPW